MQFRKIKNRPAPYHFVIVCENTFFDKTKAAEKPLFIFNIRFLRSCPFRFQMKQIRRNTKIQQHFRQQ